MPEHGSNRGHRCSWLALVAASIGCTPEVDPCESDLHAQNWAEALLSCESAFLRTGQHHRALDAARAAVNLNRPEEVLRLTALVTNGPSTVEAYPLAGWAERKLGRYEWATYHLSTAASLQSALGNTRSYAWTMHQVGGVEYERGDYKASLEATERALRAALSVRDLKLANASRIARTSILRMLGRFEEAELELGELLEESLDPAERMSTNLKLGILRLDRGLWPRARQPLVAALAEARALPAPKDEDLAALFLNLSFVERKAGAFSQALELVEQARAHHTDTMSYRLNRGLALADAGRYVEAAADLELAEAEGPLGQWRPWVPYQHALVMLKLGDEAKASELLRRAITRTAELAKTSGTWGPTAVATQRAPHLELAGLLAKRGAWRELLEVIAHLDGQSLMISSEASKDLAPSSTDAPPLLAARDNTRPASVDDIIQAWQGRWLVIVFPSGGRIWRVELRDGVLQGRDVGGEDELREIQDRLEIALPDRLEDSPLAVEGAQALGAALLPKPQAVERRTELLVVGPLSRVPLSALFDGSVRAISRRQLVRVPGVLPRKPVVRAGVTGAVAIGDPTGDLPQSAEEARRVARRLGGRAFTGRDATRAVLSEARGAYLLHIAAHTDLKEGSGILALHDGVMLARQISELSDAPPLVVLASCASAVGIDDAGNGSVAHAFLDAGADLVVATRWSIPDIEAAAVSEAFYATGGARDPVTTLSKIQLQPPAGVKSLTWTSFEVIAARPDRWR